jgi:hypothetical protein
MVKEGALTHDGDERLARHLRNAVPHKSETREYATFGKSHPASKRNVDAAVALTLAIHARHADATREPGHRKLLEAHGQRNRESPLRYFG